eukprot:SAG22_NODE_296_length_12811_cov_14.899780_15_plen_184_part_00
MKSWDTRESCPLRKVLCLPVCLPACLSCLSACRSVCLPARGLRGPRTHCSGLRSAGSSRRSTQSCSRSRSAGRRSTRAGCWSGRPPTAWCVRGHECGVQPQGGGEGTTRSSPSTAATAPCVSLPCLSLALRSPRLTTEYRTYVRSLLFLTSRTSSATGTAGPGSCCRWSRPRSRRWPKTSLTG